MEAATGNIVVFRQRKDLGLISIAVLIGAVQDPVDILGKSGTPDRRRLIVAMAAQCLRIREGLVYKGTVLLFLFHPGGQTCGKLFFCHKQDLLFFYHTIMPQKCKKKQANEGFIRVKGNVGFYKSTSLFVP